MEFNTQMLEELCDKIIDCPHSTPKWTSTGVIVLRNQNIRNGRLDLSSASFTDEPHYQSRVKRAVPQSGDIILTREAPMGEVCIVPEDLRCCLGQRQVLLRPKKEVNGNYLFYALQSSYVKNQISWSEGTGSVVSNLRIPLIKQLKIPRFDKTHEVFIATLMSKIDKKIDLNRQANDTLESIAQALFKSWFIDFDPVHAKAEGREPEGMDAETAALFPDSFEESELGAIPKKWYVTNLGDAYEINPTRRLKKSELAPYLDMANVPTRGHHAAKTIMREMGSGTKFINGDTLLARITPCLENGKTAFVDFLDDNQIGWGSTEFVVLRPKVPIPPYHGYLLARYSPFREFAIQSMSGTSGRQRIQSNVLSRYLITIPSESLLKVFGSVVSSIQQKITANSRQAMVLEQQRDTLLPRLISGDLQLSI